MANAALEQIKGIAKNANVINSQIETLYYIIKEFGWTIWEINDTPIPTMQILIEMMEKDARRQKAASKK